MDTPWGEHWMQQSAPPNTFAFPKENYFSSVFKERRELTVLTWWEKKQYEILGVSGEQRKKESSIQDYAYADFLLGEVTG